MFLLLLFFFSATVISTYHGSLGVWVFRFFFSFFFYLWFMAVKQKGEAAKRPRGGAGYSQAAAGRPGVAHVRW